MPTDETPADLPAKAPGEAWMRRQVASPQRRTIWHVRMLVEQVRGLPPYAANDTPSDLPSVVLTACREAFYMNVRALADFLVTMPQQDRTARWLLPAWEPSGEAVDRLRAYHRTASKHVAHITRERVPDDLADLDTEDTSYAGLQRIVADVEEVLAAFVAAYLAEDHEQLRQDVQGLLPPIDADLSSSS